MPPHPFETRTAARPGAGRQNRGFTLVELMIVVLLIGTLATMVLPNYRKSVLKAQSADLVTKIEAINIALKDYEADHGEPPAGTGPVGTAPAWLEPYAPDRLFTSANGITYQLVVTTGVAPTLILSAGSDPMNTQVTLAAAGTLGNRVSVSGGGSTLVITLSN